MSRTSSTVPALGLLLLGYALVAGEPVVVAGVLGVALWAWEMAHHSSTAAHPTTGSRPTVAVRALHRSRARDAVPRQQDPDASGHVRARAPAAPRPAVPVPARP